MPKPPAPHDLYGCNHHHPIKPETQAFVDFGTGRFVADKPLIPLLKALNEIGLRTRSHDMTDGHAWVAIVMDDDVGIEIRTAYERDSGRDTFDGCRQLMISWRAPDTGGK